MPELPEVQTTIDTLAPRICGRKILSVDLRRKDVLQPSGVDLNAKLAEKRVAVVHRRGKRIIIELDDGNRFYVHLGMTGRLTAEAGGTPLLPHTHLVVRFEKFEMRFRDARRFGGIWWVGTQQADENMGPEPLETKPAELAARLARTTRAIKNALLDQSLIAGLGNIYVDESLFAAGIHPLRRADRLSLGDVAKLNRAIKSTLRRALRHRGSTLRDYVDANGEAGGFQNMHAVYDRTGERCRRCRNSIERIVIGGRSTHFCPKCQPAKRKS